MLVPRRSAAMTCDFKGYHLYSFNPAKDFYLRVTFVLRGPALSPDNERRVGQAEHHEFHALSVRTRASAFVSCYGQSHIFGHSSLSYPMQFGRPKTAPHAYASIISQKKKPFVCTATSKLHERPTTFFNNGEHVPNPAKPGNFVHPRNLWMVPK